MTAQERVLNPIDKGNNQTETGTRISASLSCNPRWCWRDIGTTN